MFEFAFHKLCLHLIGCVAMVLLRDAAAVRSHTRRWRRRDFRLLHFSIHLNRCAHRFYPTCLVRG